MMIPPQVAIAIASVIGAVLFFAAGFMLARVRPSAADSNAARPPDAPVSYAETTAAAPKPGVIPWDVWFEDLLADDKAAETSGSHNAAAAETQSKAADEAGSGEPEAALQALQEELAQANENLARMEKDRVLLEQEKAALKEEKNALQKQVQNLEEKAAAERSETSRQIAELKENTGESGDLKAENEKLFAELAEAKSQVEGLTYKVNSLDNVREKNKDLSVKVEMLTEQVEALERLREENRRLKSQTRAVKEMESEIKALQSENEKLHSMKIFWDAPPQPVLPFSEEGLGAMFQQIVNRLCESEKSRGAVLADELGLLVAGVGDHAEPMAGMAAVFSEISTNLKTMLPFGKIDHLSIVNQSDLTLTMRPLSVAADKYELVLATLSVGEGPGRGTIENLMQEIAATG